MTTPPADHAARNRGAWDRLSAEYLEPGRRGWAALEPSWGIWSIPEREVQALPEVGGKDVIELGCGTAYWSAWLARRGARPVGLDNSSRQLAHAHALQREHGLGFPLVHADAEHAPFSAGRFDVALSEYGASIWCDPYRWIPEAARLLRPGGELVFLKNGLLRILCTRDDGEVATQSLERDLFGLHRFEWSDDGSVEFELPHGEWIALLRANGFAIEALIELQAPPAASSRYTFVTPDWARRWPSEEIWRARKTAG